MGVGETSVAMSNHPSVAVLSGGKGWHVNDLARAGRRLGIAVHTVDFRDLQARLNSPPHHGPRLAGAAFDLTGVDAVLVRTMPGGSLEQIVFRMDLLQQIAAAGVRIINSPRSLEAAIDKYLCTARLERASLPVPPTRVAQNEAQALLCFEELGGDVVVKPLFGSEGKGLERLRSLRRARETFKELTASAAVFYLQKFIPHPGHDLRILTCGCRVLGAIRRTATQGWRTNVAQGGTASVLEPEPALADLALRAAAAVGTEVAGVDVLPDRDGRYWLLEVNGVPGWRTLAAKCGIDVASEVLSYVLTRESTGRRGKGTEG